HAATPLLLVGAPVPERRARRVGAGARGSRSLAGAGGGALAAARVHNLDATAGRAAALARRVRRLARPPLVRRGLAASGAPRSRARLLLRDRLPPLVARLPGGSAEAPRRRQGRLSLRRLRARKSTRARARAPPELN